MDNHGRCERGESLVYVLYSILIILTRCILMTSDICSSNISFYIYIRVRFDNYLKILFFCSFLRQDASFMLSANKPVDCRLIDGLLANVVIILSSPI